MYILCSPLYDANFIPETISDDTLGGKAKLCDSKPVFISVIYVFKDTCNKALNHTFEGFEIA